MLDHSLEKLGKKIVIRFMKTTDSRDHRVLTLTSVLVKTLFLPCNSLIGRAGIVWCCCRTRCTVCFLHPVYAMISSSEQDRNMYTSDFLKSSESRFPRVMMSVKISGVGDCKSQKQLHPNLDRYCSYLHNRRPCRNFTLCAFICTNIPN